MVSSHETNHSPDNTSSVVSPQPAAMTRETNSHEPNEASPLLSGQPGTLAKTADPTAVPWARLMPLVFLRMINGMAYSLIFPFITELVTNLPDVPADKIGLYVGVAEGCLMVTEAAAGVVWARLADKYGRRPCLVFGTLVTSAAGGLVGFSRGIWQVFLLRGALGLCPCPTINKITAKELSTKENRDALFAVFTPAFQAGLMLGNVLGGQLVHPYGRLVLLGGIDFFRRWPYALPCLIFATLAFSAVLYAYFNLRETRPPQANTHAETPVSAGGTYLAALRVPGFALSICLFAVFHLITFAYDSFSTIYTYTPVSEGGLALKSSVIGLYLASGSLGMIVLTPWVLPLLRKRYTNKTLMTLFMSMWTLIVLLIPVAQWVALHLRKLLLPVLGLTVLLKIIGLLSHTIFHTLMMGAFDDYPHLIATGSAISLLTGAAARAFGPSAAGGMYAVSAQFPAGTFGRQLSWLLLLVFALPSLVLVRRLRGAHEDVSARPAPRGRSAA